MAPSTTQAELGSSPLDEENSSLEEQPQHNGQDQEQNLQEEEVEEEADEEDGKDDEDEGRPGGGVGLKTSLTKRSTKQYGTLKSKAHSMLQNFTVEKYVHEATTQGNFSTEDELESFCQRLTEPGFMVLFAPAHGNLRFTCSNNWMVNDKTVKAARDLLLSAVQNCLERQKIRGLLPPENPTLSADGSVPLRGKRSAGTTKASYFFRVRTAVRLAFNNTFQHVAKQTGMKVESIPRGCNPQQAANCRAEQTAQGIEFPCGGECQALRQLLGWPGQTCLLDAKGDLRL